MSAEQNKALMERLIEEVFNQGKLDILDEICKVNYILEAPGIPTEKGKKEGLKLFKQLITSYRKAFDNLNVTIDETVAEDNMIAIGFSLSGTHKGEFVGIAPTGKHVKLTELGFAHLTDGKISGLRLAPYGKPIKVLLSA
jgi:hypothetical protein